MKLVFSAIIFGGLCCFPVQSHASVGIAQESPLSVPDLLITPLDNTSDVMHSILRELKIISQITPDGCPSSGIDLHSQAVRVGSFSVGDSWGNRLASNITITIQKINNSYVFTFLRTEKKSAALSITFSSEELATFFDTGVMPNPINGGKP